MQQNTLFLKDSSTHLCLVQRLADEFFEAARELRDNPREYIASAIKGGSIGDSRRRSLLRFGMAIALVIYASLFAAMLIFWALGAKQSAVSGKDKELTVLYLPGLSPMETSMPESERAAHGGGGGGDNSLTLPSIGLPPPFDDEPPVVAPTTKLPPQPPIMPIDMTLLGDPTQNLKRDVFMPAGLPDGVAGPPSNGPGSGGGIGTGKDGGVGPGSGPGFGPGKDGGQRGGPNTPGGRPTDHHPTERVDTAPIPINYPRPNYTEAARKNKVQGIVRARVLVGSDGLVKQINIMRGLSDGLNEEAIKAVLQMRFRPATRNGQAVAHWTTLYVEFNLR